MVLSRNKAENRKDQQNQVSCSDHCTRSMRTKCHIVLLKHESLLFLKLTLKSHYLTPIIMDTVKKEK